MSGPVSDVTRRLELRHRKDRRRLWRRLAVALGLVLVLAGGAYLVWFSPVLATTSVSVSGTGIVDKTQVLDAAGIQVGTALVSVDALGAANRIAGLPPVAQVSITRQWPNQIRIVVTERKAALAIAAGGGYLLADAGGVVFEAVRDAPDALVRVVADPTDQSLLVDVGTVYSSLSPSVAAEVSRLEAPSPDGIVLRLKDGSRVMWGSAEQSELKSEVLDRLLPLGGTVFDVSAPAVPARR